MGFKVNVLYEKWRGYHPLYWSGTKEYYYAYYNINSMRYPDKYAGYQVVQDIEKHLAAYKVTNRYYYNDQVIEKQQLLVDLPFQKYICRPIGYGDDFVYRIHLNITPPSHFFDLFQHGYYIRNNKRTFNPRNYYDPFTLSILRDQPFVYIGEGNKIADIINYETYPYVARDFLIKSADIHRFIDYMEQCGWENENVITDQKQVYLRLKEIHDRINSLKLEYKNKRVADRYIYRIFHLAKEKQLKHLKGKLLIDIEDICNSYMVLWDEALELKNICRRFLPLEESKEIHLDRINELYSHINQTALEEISKKHKLANYLMDINDWKKYFIKNYNWHDPLREWILVALEPYYIFSKQLALRDEDIALFKNEKYYNKHLTFFDDKYRVTFDSKIMVYPRKRTKDKNTQEKLKLMVEEYRRKPDPYIKRRIEKELKSLRSTLNIIQEIQSII